MSSETAHVVRGRLHDHARVADEGAARLGKVLWQSAKDLVVDSGLQWAAAVAYYALLSAFPLLLLAGAIAANFVEPAWVAERVTQFLGDFAPASQDQVREMVEEAIGARGQVGILSFFALLWTGTRVFDALVRALYVANGLDDTSRFVRRLVTQVAMLLTVGLAFLLSLASGLLMELAWDAAEMVPADTRVAFEAAQGAIRAALLLGAYFLLFRFVPSGREGWSPALIGAGVASLLFLVARLLFVLYVEQFGRYNVIYGSLATVILLLVWIWIVGLITIYGGEVAAHAREILVEGRDPEDIGRRHREGAGGGRDR